MSRTINAQSPLLTDDLIKFEIKGRIYYTRPIKGYLGYFASTCGQVISLISSNRQRVRKLDWSNPQVLSGKDNGNGYLQVLLYSVDGHGKWHRVNRLVALTHLRKPVSDRAIDELHVNHLNKHRKDNHVRNLAWTTPTENMQWNVLEKKRLTDQL